jgi:hypothetical protein
MSDENRTIYGIQIPEYQAENGSCVYLHADGHEVELAYVSDDPATILALNPTAVNVGVVTKWLRNTGERQEVLAAKREGRTIFRKERLSEIEFEFDPEIIKPETKSALTKFLDDHPDLRKFVDEAIGVKNFIVITDGGETVTPTVEEEADPCIEVKRED